MPAEKSEQRKEFKKEPTGWQKTKRVLGAIWHFLWHEDSVLSWIANVIVAFVLIKFVVYPLLGLLLGTSFPIVAVVSESMEHDGTFNNWWQSSCIGRQGNTTQATVYEQLGIDKTTFRSYRFNDGFNKGDLMILVSAEDATIGDVLIFSAPSKSDPIIHRIVEQRDGTSGIVYGTKGDHNCGQDDKVIMETSISQDRVLGKAAVRIPFLGWIKIGFVTLVNTMLGR